MDAKYFEEIKTREQAATKGPWYEEGWALPNENDDYVELIDDSPADAAFIAHARTDIPALIAEAERLQKSNEIYSEENHGLYQQIATLKKALEMACKRNAEYAFCGGTEAMKEKHAEKNFQYFIQQAQEQEGEK